MRMQINWSMVYFMIIDCIRKGVTTGFISLVHLLSVQLILIAFNGQGLHAINQGSDSLNI